MRLIFFSALFFSYCSTCFAEAILSAVDDSLNIANPTTEDTSFVRINSITIIGNKKTKSEIIFRELAFHNGDSLSQSSIGTAIQRSKENMLNTSLFNFVDIFYKTEDSIIDVIIIVSERWYIWPLPIFELVDRNFNEWLL
ncbi:MAG: hypothetical protein JJE25_10195, partial [Bacteroidia bacterium]|nr:hypothetical protein [Bacteroidia bacterium]